MTEAQGAEIIALLTAQNQHLQQGLEFGHLIHLGVQWSFAALCTLVFLACLYVFRRPIQ